MKPSVIHIIAAITALGCGAIAEELPGAAPIAPGHPNLPDGFELTAHMLCGAGLDKVGNGGVNIALTRGAQRSLADVSSPTPGEAFDSERVEFTISGLDASNEYVIGFTWWDHDQSGRRQSVQFGAGEPAMWSGVLPPVVPLAFHGDQPTYARIQLPVPANTAETGRLLIAFERSAGPDVVVNEVWLLRKARTQPKKRVVIVTGDDWGGHHWRATGPELANILRGDPRLEVSIVEAPAIFAAPLADYYDAAIIHFKEYANRLPLGDEVWKGLDRFVAGGHGLVIAHFGCGAFQEWDAYVQIAGRVWDPQKRAHDPYGPFHVRVADESHPISAGMSAFDTSDELYTCLAGEPEIHVLFDAVSRIDQQNYPMGFVVAGSPGRVFHSPLGHDVPALRSAGARELYRRAAAWAAGLPPAIE